METFDYKSISVKRIKELSFNINELIFPLEGNPLRSEISIKLGFNSDSKIVELVVRIAYHNSENTDDQILAEISVQNVFEILDLESYFSNNNLILPRPLIATLVGMSVSHTRALFSKCLAGTVLNDNNLILINPEDVAKHFFPDMFK
jgi:hypothetical protein